MNAPFRQTGYQRPSRMRKIIAAAMLAVAVVGVGACANEPTAQAPTSAPYSSVFSTSAAPQTTAPAYTPAEQAFLRDYPNNNPANALQGARAICMGLRSGMTREKIVNATANGATKIGTAMANQVVDAAVKNLCPDAAVAAAPTPPPPPPAPTAPKVYEGRGDDVVTLDKGTGPALVDFECLKCTSNVIVKTDGHESVLVNEIGSYKGRTIIDVYDNSVTSTVEIKAKGAWKMTITENVTSARTSHGEPITGHGDDVVLIAGSSTKAAVEHRRGDSNFIVKTISDEGMDVPVNAIGGYSGTVLMPAPSIVIIQANGDWTITPS